VHGSVGEYTVRRIVGMAVGADDGGGSMYLRSALSGGSRLLHCVAGGASMYGRLQASACLGLA
jgi:hypothetical protein